MQGWKKPKNPVLGFFCSKFNFKPGLEKTNKSGFFWLFEFFAQKLILSQGWKKTKNPKNHWVFHANPDSIGTGLVWVCLEVA
jgi:hypothetical protein